MFQNKDIFIFDLDGTLIDSLGMWNEVDKLLMEFLGGEPLEEHARQTRRETLLTRFRKEPDPYLMYCRVLKESCGSPLPAEQILKKRYEIADTFLRNSVCLKPGAAKLLHRLKQAGKILVLASSTSRANIEIYASENRNIYENACFTDLFSLIYGRDDVAEIKPSPAVYKKVLETLSVSPQHCIAFEDSVAGVQAATGAGLDVVCIYDKYSQKDKDVLAKMSLAYFESFQELNQAISDTFHA